MATGCLYCDRNETQKDLMIEICDLSVSTVFLFKEQTYYGRCIVAYKDHNVELYELNDEDLLAYMKDTNKVAAAMKKLFNPEKINYGAYSDKLKHLHMHLVPKYVDGTDFGGVFVMNPQQKYLSDTEYSEMVDKIKKELGK
ncbi:HIT family protein [Dysgonomonas sp. 216]|uniref:HIT family protein n=1 Tax=Dysgonomonas sp. 216 TaxID=2302934 RepID=UPI0013D67BBB|nr:HIT family protein [Dysgonomonas sp. 216]NDW18305.1 HIT family protein [Dysgonomonas sp. 216]NDW18673.1 HIT family protein [Dysgonomonas sp. 216]